MYGLVYDLAGFLEHHPAGAEAITDQAGTDATDVFEAVHTRSMLKEFKPIGRLVQ